jgi:hypothetical protein
LYIFGLILGVAFFCVKVIQKFNKVKPKLRKTRSSMYKFKQGVGSLTYISQGESSMVICDLEYLDIVSESQEASGIWGGARAFFNSRSWVTASSAGNRTIAFASGKNLAVAAGTSGASYLVGSTPAGTGLIFTAGGNGFAFGL